MTVAAATAVAVTVAMVGATGADAGSGKTAAAAKKCKKGHKAVAAKKCKKKHSIPFVPPTPPAAPAPPAPAPKPAVERAELDWTGNADLDLNVVDTTPHTGCFECDDNDIPLEFSGTPGVQTDGFEEADDPNNPSTSKLSFMACAFEVDASTDWELDVQYADGSTDSMSGTVGTGTTGLIGYLNDPNGGFDASTLSCPS